MQEAIKMLEDLMKSIERDGFGGFTYDEWKETLNDYIK